MGPLDAFNHLFNFLAPAVFMAGVVLVASRFLGRKKPVALAWWLQLGLTAAVCSAALVAGLVLFGRDGKMATYALLVVCCALTQWLVSGDWKR